MVEKMIAKLLGDGYSILCGTISATRDNVVDAELGNNASFDVYALLEKDGRIYEYSETIAVSKSYGDVYQTVLNKEQRDNIYKKGNKTLTDLGDVAALYWAECNK